MLAAILSHPLFLAAILVCATFTFLVYRYVVKAETAEVVRERNRNIDTTTSPSDPSLIAADQSSKS